MDFRKATLLLTIAVIVFISGCTSPICLPFLPCGNVVEYEDDIVVVKSLDALPQTVSPGQQIRLIAYIQNLGKDSVPQKEGQNKLTKITGENQKIFVNLYDYCKGLFSDVKVSCDGSQPQDCKDEQCKCSIVELLPGQVKEIDWTLKAGSSEQVPLRTECDLKVSVTYPYKTTSLTEISFIDYAEMQNRLNEGTFRKKESYIVSGYGPIKPWITVEDQQPIPVQQGQAGRTVISLQIKNSGSGYLCRLNDTSSNTVVCDSKIPKENVEVSGIGGDSRLEYVTGGTCTLESSGSIASPKSDVTLIKKESPPLLCEIELKEDVNLPKETTKYVTTTAEYLYEFRKELKVIIEPKI